MKRFTVDEWDIWDYADSMLVILQDGEFMSNADVCELLNKLVDENEQLKIQNRNLISISAHTQVRNDRLIEEKERLMAERDYYKLMLESLEQQAKRIGVEK